MIIVINNLKWNLSFTNRLYHKDDGACSDPTNITGKRRIRVRDSLTGERRLVVLLHEMLHAADWSKDETWVEKIAEDIGKVLYDCGWRRISEESPQE